MSIRDGRSRRPLEGGPTFPLRHRFFRAAWGLAWGLLGSWTPAPLFAWRRMLLRCFGARIDPSAKVYPGVRIWYPPNLEMAAFSYLGRGANCYCMDRVTLEYYALVSQGAHLCAGTHDIDDPDFPLRTRPIRIGRNAWVAAEAFVGPGVTIGEGAVLGARAVAMKDLEPWSVHAGNPAVRLRDRRRIEEPGVG